MKRYRGRRYSAAKYVSMVFFKAAPKGIKEFYWKHVQSQDMRRELALTHVAYS
jgi:sarcosine oxidase delta subunit